MLIAYTLHMRKAHDSATNAHFFVSGRPFVSAYRMHVTRAIISFCVSTIASMGFVAI
jgi:hypothetical protein